MEQRFDIYLTGNFTEGTDPQAAIAAFAAAAGISVDKAQELFDKAPSAIKRNCDEATADSYQNKLAGLGIETERRALQSESADLAAAPVAATESTAASPSSEAPATRRLINFVFSGEGYEYFKIWIVNILLVIVTLGIYAPWAKVRNTQYFYGNTTLDGASFAFTADPVKMLIGRLIALGLFIAYAVVNALAPIVGGLLALGLLFVFPWVMNRSLAFYARNTTYRNIRFAFGGSYWGAFKAFLLWPLAGMLTLLLLFPMALKKQQEYVIGNHRYGNKSFAFNAATGDFYMMFLKTIGLVIAGAVVGALLAMVFQPLGGIGFFVGYILAIIYFIVTMNNLTLNHSSLAEHNLKANYELKGFGLLMVANFLLTVVTLGLYIPWAKVKLAHYAAEHTQLDALGSLDRFAAITQEEVSAFGEEFGDVFDMEVGF